MKTGIEKINNMAKPSKHKNYRDENEATAVIVASY
jgi:hypothetical protein